MNFANIFWSAFLLQIFLNLGMMNAYGQARCWQKYELSFESDRLYDNPIYDARDFTVTFNSPTGRTLKVPGFWDGGKQWKVRFCPDEPGEWQWSSSCSDEKNTGLNQQSGRFQCETNKENEAIYQHGAVRHFLGRYHLSYNDGTPFFWMGCTAWNGALLSTDKDWETYLKDRESRGYSVIQLVTTQWRGCAGNAEGQVAFTGSGKIVINPEFFRRIDKKIDAVNAHGLVAAPVMLWALPFGQGRDLSPGYYLPEEEAVLLGRYIVARFQGNQVVWVLGGDGKYYGDLESRWKQIGHDIFTDIDHAPVTLHPHGISFVGDLYADQPWYDIMGYQSSHSKGERTVNWINKGPMVENWSVLRAMPYINMEPLYEQILKDGTTEDVRHAVWWSLFATPVAGVTYGANGIWPWLEEDGQPIQNHGAAPWTSSWSNSLKLPVSQQMAYVKSFFKALPWWELFPAQDLLVKQPGDEQYDRYVGVLATDDRDLVTIYFPGAEAIQLRLDIGKNYDFQWFNPATGKYSPATFTVVNNLWNMNNPSDQDMVLMIRSKS